MHGKLITLHYMQDLREFYFVESTIYHSDQIGCKEPVDQTILWLDANHEADLERGSTFMDQ